MLYGHASLSAGFVALVHAHKGCQAKASPDVRACLRPPKETSHSALKVTALIVQPMSLLEKGRQQSFHS